ncbi:hypothetical protein EJ05DRAFT_306904 [Pseudovirgaria hyperparasitica]|uniref:Uncharacterized protein n=1 Tax=Pseudovirgaria hyperparasitica TaxID=470096 RepID=A0A6A6WAV7_9PEZI|nr:uncharacterized protein EJ05DRAFT_306904 [Pseudovirgaria hyperparasitica]KAF2759695.1 hypothetical protein EJ05DRAFT_306904 [Pseudovirgaria hyperparasitica]
MSGCEVSPDECPVTCRKRSCLFSSSNTAFLLEVIVYGIFRLSFSVRSGVNFYFPPFFVSQVSYQASYIFSSTKTTDQVPPYHK